MISFPLTVIRIAKGDSRNKVGRFLKNLGDNLENLRGFLCFVGENILLDGRVFLLDGSKVSGG